MLCYHQNAVLCVHAPRGHTLSFLAKNESKFIKPCCAGNGGRRSTFAGNSVLLPSDVIDFAMLPAHSAQRFWRETVSVWDVIWRRSNQWERAMLGRNFQLFNKLYHGIFRFGHVALDVFSFPLEGSGAGLDVVTYPTCKKTRQRLP